jgi:hypothetical protein
MSSILLSLLIIAKLQLDFVFTYTFQK